MFKLYIIYNVYDHSIKVNSVFLVIYSSGKGITDKEKASPQKEFKSVCKFRSFQVSDVNIQERNYVCFIGKVPVSCNYCSTSCPGTDLGIWTLCCQPEHLLVCLALHHIQHPPGKVSFIVVG